MINYDEIWNDYQKIILDELNLDLTSSDEYEINNNKIFSNLYGGEYFIKSRETVINTGSSSIYNNIIYPKTGKNLPSFGVDLMAFMEKKVIIVFDFQHPTENYDFDHELVKELMGEYKYNTKEIRFFEPGNHFSEHLFVAKCTMSEVDNYLEDFTKYLLKFKEMLDLKKPSGLDTSEYHDFDSYMTKLDPVAGYLSSNFGKEKSEQFVNDFLFEYG